MPRTLRSMTVREIQGYMGDMAALIQPLTPEDTLFTFLVFLKDGNHVQYVSSADTGIMVRALREIADRIERGGGIESDIAFPDERARGDRP